MPTPVTELRQAADSLAEALSAAGVAGPLEADWTTIDPAFRKLLGGPFDPVNHQHRKLALGLTALIGERLALEPGAFWFPHRDAVGGASVGFADAVFSVSPAALASLALGAGSLVAVEEGLSEVRRDLAAAKAKGGLPRKLGAADYQKLFDPAFLELVALDAKRAAKVWELTPQAVAATLQDSLFRAPGLSRQGRRWAEELAFALRSMDPRRPLIDQAKDQPRAFERVVHLFGAVYGTGPIAERGWMEVAVRLLCLEAVAPGVPTAPGDAAAQLKAAGGPLRLFLRLGRPLPEAPREGVLGLFAIEDLKLLDPRLAAVPELRLTAVNPRKLLPLLQKHDGKRLRAAVEAFLAELSKKVGKPQRLEGHELGLLEEALAFSHRLQDTLAYAIKDELFFCVRRLSELDARSESELGPLRQVVEV